MEASGTNTKKKPPTWRDQVAALALQGILASAIKDQWLDAEEAATMAYKYADALIAHDPRRS